MERSKFDYIYGNDFPLPMNVGVVGGRKRDE
ncbi:hypothetical protein CEXT_689221, partial [Caerostris extrusa]